jgi:uncharacterized repeat protein (TIGR03803 family)
MRNTATSVLLIAVGILGVFSSVRLRAQTVTQLYAFPGAPGGDAPFEGLVQGRDGYMYGVTQGGGVNTCSNFGDQASCGTVFKTDTLGNVTIIYSFDQAGGFFPRGVTLGTDGNFYGATYEGGAYGFGTLFKVTAGGVFTKLHDFANTTDGEYPQNQLLEASDGNFYGFTQTGIYRATTAGVVTTIFTFAPYPVVDNYAPLIQATNGDLYATMQIMYCDGTTCPCGAFVKFSLQGTRISEYDFGCHNMTIGGSPFASLIQAIDGNFYGTAGSASGSAEYGDVFKIDAHTGMASAIHDFDASAEHPMNGVTQGSDGNFYGVLEEGSLSTSGIAYEVTPEGAYTELGVLANNGEDFPYWPLLQHTTGKFYGNLWFSEETYYAYYGAIYSVDNGLEPFVTFVAPQGRVGSRAQFLGQGLTGATAVTFNGVAARSFTVVSDTFMTAVVPEGATSGAVVVTTSSGMLSSNKSFRVSLF